MISARSPSLLDGEERVSSDYGRMCSPSRRRRSPSQNQRSPSLAPSLNNTCSIVPSGALHRTMSECSLSWSSASISTDNPDVYGDTSESILGKRVGQEALHAPQGVLTDYTNAYKPILQHQTTKPRSNKDIKVMVGQDTTKQKILPSSCTSRIFPGANASANGQPGEGTREQSSPSPTLSRSLSLDELFALNSGDSLYAHHRPTGNGGMKKLENKSKQLRVLKTRAEMTRLHKSFVLQYISQRETGKNFEKEYLEAFDKDR